MTTLRDHDGVVHERIDAQDGTFRPMCVIRDGVGDVFYPYYSIALCEAPMTCVRCIVGNTQRRYWWRGP